MKRILQITVITLAAIFLMPDGLSGQTTTTSTTGTAAKEKKEQEALLKATEEQKKAQEEMKKAQDELTKAKAMEESLLHNFRTGDVSYYPDGRTVVVRSQQGGSNFYGSRSMNSTTLDFSRNVTENSATKEYTFDVEKEMKMVSLSISGSCKSGEIKISVIMPGNKEYSTIMIDEVGSMSWKKTFELTEEDAKDKVGTWKFKVVTTKATGNFRLSLSGS
jgi:hypothetical protein